MSKTLGRRIKKVRGMRDMTQKQLAAKALISRSYLADVERGRYNPSLETLQKIADALGVTLDRLAGESAAAIIEDRLEEKSVSLEEVSARADVPLKWLENLDGFTPWGIEDEESYVWITRVAEVLDLPGGLLRAALARQEMPVYSGSQSTPEEDFTAVKEDAAEYQTVLSVPTVGIVPAGVAEAVEGIESWEVVPIEQGAALVLVAKVRIKKEE